MSDHITPLSGGLTFIVIQVLIMLTSYWFDIPSYTYGVDDTNGHTIFRIRHENDVIVMTDADAQYDTYEQTLVLYGPSPC